MHTREKRLKRCLQSIFPLLDAQASDKIAAYTHYGAYDSGEIIVYEEDAPIHLHLLCEGMIRIFKIGAKNEEIVMRDIDAIHLVGEMANIKQIGFPASIRALQPAKLAKIEFAKLKQEPFYSEAILPVLLDSISDKLNHHVSINIQYTFSRLPVKAKIARYLLENLDQFNSSKRYMVAKTLGIAAESLSRTLKELEAQGCIAQRGKSIVIIDLHGLEQIVVNN